MLIAELLGFAHDRGAPRNGVVVLLPLEYDYLHILCRLEFWAEQSDANQFGDVLPSLKAARVFAGPAGSTVHQLAASILARYGRDYTAFQDLLAPQITDWKQARAALRTNAIDVAFYLGPIGATTIEEIASDKNCLLLGIDDIQHALQVHEGYSMFAVKFPKNAYSAEILPLPSAMRKAQFCPRELNTVALRRLLVCSKEMSRDDAYLISTAAYGALHEDNPLIGNWDAKPTGGAALADLPKSYEAHAGAALRGQAISLWWKPHSWPPFLMSALSTLTMLVLTEMFSRWAQLSAPTRASMPPLIAGEALNPFQVEDRTLLQFLHTLETQSEPLTEATWKELDAEYRRLRRHVRALKQQAQVTDDQDEQLSVTLIRIGFELRELQPATCLTAEMTASRTSIGESSLPPLIDGEN